MVATDALDAYPKAAHSQDLVASEDGIVSKIDAMEIGLTACGLGAGRTRIEDGVDFSAGIWLHKKVGDRVSKGDALCTLHTNR